MSVLTRKMKRNSAFMEIYERIRDKQPTTNAKHIVRIALQEWEVLHQQSPKKYRAVT